MRVRVFLSIGILSAALASGTIAAQTTADAPAVRPDAVVNLATDAGVALMQGGRDAEELFRNAQFAVKQAKTAGGPQVYEPGEASAARRRFSIETELRLRIPSTPAIEGFEEHALFREVIEQELTDKQRQVLMLMVFHEMPMDEVVQQLDTNRNAIYKMLHDARRKLKSSLQARGFEVSELLTLFGESR